MSVYGRRVYEAMSYWDTAEDDPDLQDFMREFAEQYAAHPKVVASTTLDAVGPNARLLRSGVVEEVARLKAEDGGPIGLAGATLAAGLFPAGPVRE